jgi:hypothetical protein
VSFEHPDGGAERMFCSRQRKHSERQWIEAWRVATGGTSAKPRTMSQKTTRYPNNTQKVICLALVLICATGAVAQTNHYQQLPLKEIEDRLQQYSGSDLIREAALKELFREAGCSVEHLQEQTVPQSPPPNVSCTLPGTGEGVIVVGAHFDHVDAGDGVVDNWSGASLLPSLYESLALTPRRHTFVFISFAGEEKGFLGSRAYMAGLDREELADIRAMVDIDTLGLGPTEVWVSNSDPALVKSLFAVAAATHLPASVMNVDGIGDSDGHSFKARKIPIITLHSVTPETLGTLHSSRDRLSAVKISDYYDSYKLIAEYLATLDSELDIRMHPPGERIPVREK